MKRNRENGRLGEGREIKISIMCDCGDRRRDWCLTRDQEK